MVNLEYGGLSLLVSSLSSKQHFERPRNFSILVFEAESEKLFWCVIGRTVLEGVISLQQWLLPGLLLVLLRQLHCIQTDDATRPTPPYPFSCFFFQAHHFK